MATPRLDMPEIAESQANKYITHNLALKNLDGLVQMSVEDLTLVTSPSVSGGDDGKCWVVAGTGGDWSGFTIGDIAQYYDSAWYNYTPEEGWLTYDKSTIRFYYWNASNWADIVESMTGGTDVITAFEMEKRGNSDPDFYQVEDDGASSIGVFTYAFDEAVDEELYFIYKLPDNYFPANDLTISVNWIPTSADVSSTCIWELEYTWVDTGETTGNTTSISTSDLLPGTSQIKIPRTKAFSAISGTGKTNDSILFGRLLRDASNVSDDYPADAALISITIEY